MNALESVNTIKDLILSNKNPNKYSGKAIFTANVLYENTHGKKDFGIIDCQAYDEGVGKADARIVINVPPKFKFQYHSEFLCSGCKISRENYEIIIRGIGRCARMKGNYKVTLSDLLF